MPLDWRSVRGESSLTQRLGPGMAQRQGSTG